MALFKCKMCGGSLEIDNETVGTCEYCGTKQTLPRLSDERKVNLYDRANHFRRNNEFDKAMAIYEQILDADDTDAESYWSLVLCRFGIEYVEDPVSHKRIPTVNRAQFTSVFDDDNYRAALLHADTAQRLVYEEEAKIINEIQKGILAISQKEEPFDVFICYKETDQNGRRTMDSVLAQDLYDQLVREDFKVFFARITLEDKLGTAYEPYIFAALNSAKVMVVLGTRPEHFSAVWVKNEWSRYLSLIRNGKEKYLIPAYRDMDPYDLPEEFSHLQAQDMGKLGFMQDLVRGIKKLTRKDQPKQTVVRDSANAEAMLKRAFLFLEDENWESAGEYCEKVLDQEPENARAYLGKLMAQLHVATPAALTDVSQPFTDNNNYQKACRFGDQQLRQELEGYASQLQQRLEWERREAIYAEALAAMERATTEMAYKNVAESFASISGHKDADALSEACREKAEQSRKNAIYLDGCAALKTATIDSTEKAMARFAEIPGWKEADSLLADAEKQLQQLKEQREERLAREAEEKRQRVAAAIAYEKKKKKVITIVSAAAAAVVVLVLLYIFVFQSMLEYSKAKSLLEAGEYDQAIAMFVELGDYKDSSVMAQESRYGKAAALAEQGSYDEAIEIYTGIFHYKDAAQKVLSTKYAKAMSLAQQKAHPKALALFEELADYSDSKQQYQNTYQDYIMALIEQDALGLAETEAQKFSKKSSSEAADPVYVALQQAFEAKGEYANALVVYGKTKAYVSGSDVHKELAYKAAEEKLEEKDYNNAAKYYKLAAGYQDADEKLRETRYREATDLIQKKDYSGAIETLTYLKDYKESEQLKLQARYGYVKSNYDRENVTTYNYMRELKEANYQDSAELFKELYAWKVEIVVNDDEENSTKNMTSISKYSNWYFHVKLSGGEPNGEVRLRYTGYFPDGSVHSGEWDSNWGDGWSGTCYFWYNNPAYGNQGTFRLKVSDGNGNLIGEKTVKITG